MAYLWGFVGWILGSLLPSLEAAILAYQNGLNRQKLADAQKQLIQAQLDSKQLQRSVELKQAMDAAGTVGAERMRQWYSHLSA